MEVTGTVEPEHARAVSSHHPFAADRNYGRDPVMFESGRRGGVVDLHVALLEQRKAAQRARHQFISGNAERVNVVVDQPLEGIHAARTGGVEKRQPCRRGQGQAVLIAKQRR